MLISQLIGLSSPQVLLTVKYVQDKWKTVLMRVNFGVKVLHYFKAKWLVFQKSFYMGGYITSLPGALTIALPQFQLQSIPSKSHKFIWHLLDCISCACCWKQHILSCLTFHNMCAIFYKMCAQKYYSNWHWLNNVWYYSCINFVSHISDLGWQCIHLAFSSVKQPKHLYRINVFL